MNKNLIFQVDIDANYDHLAHNFWRPYKRHDILYRDSKIAAIDYATKIKADYFCLSEPMILGNMSPVYQKLSAYILFEKFDYEKILLLDSDAIVQPNCPNIFDFDLTSGTRTTPDGEHQPTHDNYDFLNIDHSYKKFFCTGVLLLTREFYECTKDYWKKELEYWKDKNDRGTHDQSVYNVIAYKYFPHEKINMLEDDWGAWWKDSKFINHYAGYRKREYISQFTV